MKKLLKKEFTLAAHPTNYIFPALSALILVPNYTFYVIFFYTCLGIFLMCLSGRENRDLEYSLLLPVGKADIVDARLLFCAMLEIAQLLLTAVFSAVRSIIGMAPNAAGIEPNASFFGLSLIMLAIFNHVFFSMYFMDPGKVGRAFVAASAAMFGFICAAEASVFAVPFMRSVIDAPDPEHPLPKLMILTAGIAIYSVWGIMLRNRCRRSFISLDL